MKLSARPDQTHRSLRDLAQVLTPTHFPPLQHRGANGRLPSRDLFGLPSPGRLWLRTPPQKLLLPPSPDLCFCQCDWSLCAASRLHYPQPFPQSNNAALDSAAPSSWRADGSLDQGEWPPATPSSGSLCPQDVCVGAVLFVDGARLRNPFARTLSCLVPAPLACLILPCPALPYLLPWQGLGLPNVSGRGRLHALRASRSAFHELDSRCQSACRGRLFVAFAALESALFAFGLVNFAVLCEGDDGRLRCGSDA